MSDNNEVLRNPPKGEYEKIRGIMGEGEYEKIRGIMGELKERLLYVADLAMGLAEIDPRYYSDMFEILSIYDEVRNYLLEYIQREYGIREDFKAAIIEHAQKSGSNSEWIKEWLNRIQ